ncbi:MAG: PEP-CTERM sorting domain-containing protein [Candidatus Omnitrophota bacterium]
MKKHFIWVLTVLLIGVVNPAQAVIIDWTSVVSNSNVPSASNALGDPDGVHASFYDTSRLPLYATFSGFGDGDSADYLMSGFAALLGISEATLANADFFTAEVNGGTSSTYESGLWEFSDGSNYLPLNFDSANPSDLEAVIAYGSININNYANFFGFTNPITPGHSWAFLLFDINGNSNINMASTNLSVRLTASNIGSGPADPDPDVMGRINSTPNHAVPELSSMFLFGMGLLGAGLIKRRNAVKIE